MATGPSYANLWIIGFEGIRLFNVIKGANWLILSILTINNHKRFFNNIGAILVVALLLFWLLNLSK
jgi:hypothetical protein